MTLPLRHAGMGLRAVQAIEADAALVSGAAKAEAAVANGPDSCKPFSGASRPGLHTTWQRVYDYAGDENRNGLKRHATCQRNSCKTGCPSCKPPSRGWSEIAGELTFWSPSTSPHLRDSGAQLAHAVQPMALQPPGSPHCQQYPVRGSPTPTSSWLGDTCSAWACPHL